VNVAEDPQAFRDFEYSGWHQVADKYHAAWAELTGQAVEPALDALGVSAGTTVLDVATGPGHLAAAAAGRGAAVTALDFSPQMLAKARSLHPSVDFRLGDAQDLPFESESFDAVAMNFGILHLPEPPHAILEAFRVLRRGGAFGYTVWAEPGEARGFALVLGAVERFGVSVAIPQGPDFFYFSKPENSRAALTAAGFIEPVITQVDMHWRLSGADDVFPAFLEGTARTGALLRLQSEAARQTIAADITRAAAGFIGRDGVVDMPMPAVLAQARKP
jgi:SAM-dependent methyltransferase